MRNVFYRVSCALARFMYGRNGSDQLNVALLVVYLFICLLRALFIHSAAAAAFFNILTLLTAAALLLRMFSRNLDRRRAENARFLSWWSPVRRRLNGLRQRSRDRDHKYFTCKNCKTVCRVPAGKGKIEITCPKSGGKIIGRS